MFSHCPEIFCLVQNSGNLVYTTLRRWGSVWPLESRIYRSHISQRNLKAKLAAWNPVEWPNRAACVCFTAWPSGTRSLNKFRGFHWPWCSVSLIWCHFSQAVQNNYICNGKLQFFFPMTFSYNVNLLFCLKPSRDQKLLKVRLYFSSVQGKLIINQKKQEHIKWVTPELVFTIITHGTVENCQN